MKPVIQKIKLSKEQQEEIDKINKHEKITRVKIVTRKDGLQYEYTTNKPLTPDVARKRLAQLYGSKCLCGQEWPSYIVTYDVGDERQPAKRIERYCEKCFSKRKDGIK